MPSNRGAEVWVAYFSGEFVYNYSYGYSWWVSCNLYENGYSEPTTSCGVTNNGRTWGEPSNFSQGGHFAVQNYYYGYFEENSWPDGYSYPTSGGF
ncbi:MAG TPA: hypothetical protein VNF24_03170 [Candidatus Acidoferrales bacterium]|nr:hypothetical protein [Candidatus Acidoferrales bacterium]